MKVYIFGNGNISYDDFEEFYLKPMIRLITDDDVEFMVCDFRGVDTLVMEYLKSNSYQVTVLHVGEKPRYFPDKFRTKVSQWEVIGGFKDDKSRDNYAVENCSHFIAKDFNSDDKKKSGTQRNIELCVSLNKIQIKE